MHEPELLTRPQDELFCDPRQVYGANRQRAHGFEQEVAAADGIERVAHGPLEAERTSGRFPIDGKRRSCERSATEWTLVESFDRVGEPASIPLEHLGPGQ